MGGLNTSEEGPRQTCGPQPHDKVVAVLAPAGNGALQWQRLGRVPTLTLDPGPKCALAWRLQVLGDPFVSGWGYRLLSRRY